MIPCWRCTSARSQHRNSISAIPQGDQWKGDLLALAAAVITSVFFVSARFLEGEMLPSLMVGGAAGSLIALIFDTDVGGIPESLDWLFLWVQGFVVMGFSFALLSVGPRQVGVGGLQT